MVALVGLEIGNYNRSRVSFGLSRPLMADALFLRVSGYTANRDGYYTNTYLNKNAGGSEGWGGTGNLRYFPSEVFSAELFANLEAIDETPVIDIKPVLGREVR